jgi:protein-tyrosine phosphatase
MRLDEFVDIHAHLLPGFDDGPATVAESLELARCYAGAGIGTVFATPHYLPGTAWAAGPEKTLAATAGLREALAGAGIALRVFCGMEIAITRQMGKNLDKGLYLPLGNSSFYLLEPPLEPVSFDVFAAFNDFIERRKGVILAHPERCAIFQKSPDRLRELHARGIGLQVNLGSFLGRFGRRPQRLAMLLLEWGLVDYIASDAHNAGRRRPPDRAEWQRLEKIVGDETLALAARDNPLRLAAE